MSSSSQAVFAKVNGNAASKVQKKRHVIFARPAWFAPGKLGSMVGSPNISGTYNGGTHLYKGYGYGSL